MAKFKKKKSAPMPGSDDSKDKVADINDIPETEKSESITNNSKDPPIINAATNEKNKKLSTLFWMRIGLGIIAGIATTFIFEDIEGEERRWASIVFMIIVFFASIIVAKKMNMQLPSSDRKKIVTQGIGSYVFLYLFAWIVSYTLTHLGDISTGINL
ncbi:MAG: hypothetical protein CK526_04575 [Thaumarchaeota archaeon]|nr:hypothetical protein [Nitrosopumilus sp.]PHY04222.1 MAG: hypothetical protein CK526_04575 [Nitrososphaerota archaeon]